MQSYRLWKDGWCITVSSIYSFFETVHFSLCKGRIIFRGFYSVLLKTVGTQNKSTVQSIYSVVPGQKLGRVYLPSCLPVCLHLTTRERQNIFSLNLIIESFTKNFVDTFKFLLHLINNNVLLARTTMLCVDFLSCENSKGFVFNFLKMDHVTSV